MNAADFTYDDVRNSICTAFKNVRLAGPSINRLIENKYDSESQEYARVFGGRYWEDLEFDTLIKNAGALYFFATEAFHCFIPAFMLVAIKPSAKVRPPKRRAWQADLVDTLCLHLTLPLTPCDSPHVFFDRLSWFTPEQIDATKKFLSYVWHHMDREFLTDRIRPDPDDPNWTHATLEEIIGLYDEPEDEEAGSGS